MDGDIKGYFDNIDQGILMELVKRRISDRRVLKLLRQWLKAGVMEEGTVTTATAGTPQGGVISPSLANVYLHELDSEWQARHRHLGTLVRYADDFVVLCRTEAQARAALAQVKAILDRLKLTLLHRLMARRGGQRRSKAGAAYNMQTWPPSRFASEHNLHRLLGTIRYPGGAHAA